MKKFFLAGILSAFLPSTASAMDIDVAQFKEILKDKNTVILDVRTADEYKSGHIKGSINIDFYSPTFEESVSKLDKTKTYAIYCRSGNRSGQSVKLMKKHGYNNLYNLIGGLSNSYNRSQLNVIK